MLGSRGKACLTKSKKASGATADVNESQLALIAAGEDLVQWQECVPSRGVLQFH